MRDLVAAGLVEQVSPSAHLHKIPHFDEAFIEFLHKEKKKYIKRRKPFSFRRRKTFLIHIEKMMWGISKELVDLDLAKPKDYPWYEVEDWAASAFMAYLASTLGQLDEIDAIPVTNDWKRYRRHKKPTPWLRSGGRYQRINIRNQILENILPYPSGDIDIDNLVGFKDQHGYLLEKLRNYVERKSIEISNMPDDEERKEFLELTINEVNEKADNINGLMKNYWKIILLGVITPVLGGGLAMWTDNPFVSPIGWASSGMSLVAAAYQASGDYRAKKDLLNQPFAYIALAEKELGLTA